MKLPGKDMPWKRFLQSLREEWKRDRISDTAAALTYYAVLALFPFLLFTVSLAGLLMNPANIEQMVTQLGDVAPEQVTQIVSDRLNSLAQSNSAGLLTIGALAAVWAASGGLLALGRMLNLLYGVEERRPFWKTRGMAIGLTLLTAVLALGAALIAVAIPPIAQRIGGPIGTALVWARLPVAGLLMMVVWAVLYYALPDVQQKFRFITAGSMIGVIVWVIASWGFSIYVRNFGKYEATYGALGGVIVMLLWMWISAVVVLLGAEINTVLEHASPEGKRVGAKSLADRGVGPTKAEAERQREREAPPISRRPPSREPEGRPLH